MAFADDVLINAKAYRWVYADSTEREAAVGFVAQDVGALALQLSDASLWILADAGGPTWVAAAGTAGMSNPMTTAGDIIVGGSGGSPARLAKGADATVLTIDPSTHLPVWAAPSAGSALTVEETDGSPTDNAITKIKFPPGTLAITSHEATYTPTNLISEQVLGTAAATITVTIPAGYKDLELEIGGRGTASAGNVTVTARLNGDSGSNYDFIQRLSNTAGVGLTQATAQTSMGAGFIPAATGPSDTPGGFTVRLRNYENTTHHKQLDCDGGLKNGTGAGNLFDYAYRNWWRSTAAITSIVLSLSSGNWDVGSYARLYRR